VYRRSHLAWSGVPHSSAAVAVTIATSPEGEHYYVLGTRYKGILADALTDLSQLKGKRALGSALKAAAIEPCAKKFLPSPA
jgi:hypothetical protein